MLKDSIGTHVITFDTTKHFIILIETMFFKISQGSKNSGITRMQLRIATVTRFIAYFAANTAVL